MKGKTSPVVACDTSLRGTINAGFSSTSKQREEPEIILQNPLLQQYK